MGTNPLILLCGGALLILLGLRALRNKQVYLGRLIRFIGPKLFLKGKVSVWVYGALLSVSGALTMVMSVVTLENPESDLIEQVGPYVVVLLFAGFFGSMVVEFIYYKAGWPPYDDTDEVIDDRDSFREIYR